MADGTRYKEAQNRSPSITENCFCAQKSWFAMKNNYEGVTNGVRMNETGSEDRGVKLAIALSAVKHGNSRGRATAFYEFIETQI